MRHLKRTIFTLLGTAFIAVPTIAVILQLIKANYNPNDTIGESGAIALLALVIIVGCTIFFCLIGALINKIFDERTTIFTAFFLISLQKRKRLYHSTMGEFELIIDEKDMDGILIRQGFFSCLTISNFNLEREDFMIRIKEYLDSKYKDEITEKEERKRKRELVNKLMKEEGYLDVEGKRDDKINKLGIK